jgi:uncharacterized membrane protein
MSGKSSDGKKDKEQLPAASEADKDSPPIEAAVRKQIEAALSPTFTDPTERGRIATLLVSVSQSFSGPLPPPATLSGYEQILSGSADRILGMAEKEQGHRHWIELLSTAYPYLGMIFGASLSAGCVYGAFLLARQGQTAGAGLLVGVPVVGLISWFVKARLTRELPTKPSPKPAQSKVARQRNRR